MKPGCLFLRIGSVLPESLNLPVEDACDGWTLLRSNGMHQVVAKVRASSWHFMGLNLVSLQVRAGLTPGAAVENAVRSALNRLNGRFNTAELIAVTVKKYPGFHVARVEIASRHIQQWASMGLVDQAAFRVFATPSEA